MRLPTKQFNDVCDRHCVVTAGKILGMAMLRACPGYEQKFVADFQRYNKTSTKYRAKGKYCDAQVGKARDAILDLPFVEVKRKFAAYVYELVIHPFDWTPGQKNSNKLNKNIFKKVKKGFAPENRSKPDSKKGSKNRDRGEGLKQQQHYIAIKSLLAKTGFKFMPHVISRIANYSAKAIALSIEYVRGRMTSRKHVANPEGYLLDCLEKGYWECLEGRSNKLTHYEEVVASTRSGMRIIKEKIQLLQERGEIPLKLPSGIDPSWHINRFLSCLEDEYYGGNAIAELITNYF